MPKKKAATMSIGQRIKQTRESANITQVELAVSLGVTQGAIHQYEQSGDEIQLVTLRKIAKALSVTVHDIVCN